ncbi:hypothetical protein AGMMS50230_00910 [Spirochaetia bacterium]|nr:hypothetical protein AGMMS50230_00910 [Spirochaetia bacterium]
MKHLFIINPKARQISGRVDEIKNSIQKFFAANPRFNYSIHVSRWKRDASGYTLRYVTNSVEMVRVYSLGGSSTLFEVINGVLGLPNAQVAWFPFGKVNSLLYVFGGSAFDDFQSLQNLHSSPVITIDTIRAGSHYIINHILIGTEAEVFRMGNALEDRFRFGKNFSYIAAGILSGLTAKYNKYYRMEIDDKKSEGIFCSILLANSPVYGAGLRPAPEALLNDGYMDLYAIKRLPRSKFIAFIKDYETGNYKKWPQYITHYRCKKFKVSSDSSMTISLDGNLFYDTTMEFEINPQSLDFVCPPGIKLPGLPNWDSPDPDPGDPLDPGDLLDPRDLLDPGDLLDPRVPPDPEVPL